MKQPQTLVLITVFLVAGLAACGSSAPDALSSRDVVAGVSSEKVDVLQCKPITRPAVHGPLTPLDSPPPAYDWQDGWQSCEVLFPSRLYGAMLYATLFVPADLSGVQGRLPAVVFGPGSVTGVQANYHWSARELAAKGYIALTVNPMGVSHSESVAASPQTIENYMDAVASGMDFLESAANPVQAITDTTRFGAGGHSLAAWAVSKLQGEDPRIKAIVAWDGHVSEANGDGASAIGPSPVSDVIGSLTAGEVPLLTPERTLRPRAPAMGQFSDAANFPDSGGPGGKKIAYEHWRAAGVPSMSITFLGKAHLDWGQSIAADTASDGPKSIELRLFQHYTRAWFDLWLKNDKTAIQALTAREVHGQGVDQIYSAEFEPALYLPEQGIDCPDMRLGC